MLHAQLQEHLDPNFHWDVLALYYSSIHVVKAKECNLRKHLPRIVDICILGSCPGLIPAEIGQNWPKLAEIGRNWPKLAEIGRNWPKLAKIDRHSRVRHGPI